MWDGSCARLINIFVFQIDTLIRWRRGRDSNPRYPCEYAAFRVRCFQPLSHLSEAVSPTPIPLKTQAIHADLAVPISPSERFAPALAAFPLSRAFANQHCSL